MKKEPNKNSNKKTLEQLASFFGFVIHKHYGWNLLIIFGLNLVLGAVTIGIFSQFFPLVQTTITSYLFAIAIFTLFEYISLILLFRFFPQSILFSFGTVTIIVDGLLLLLVDTIVDNFTFLQPRFETIVTFTSLILILRWTVSLYIRKIINAKGEK